MTIRFHLSCASIHRELLAGRGLSQGKTLLAMVFLTVMPSAWGALYYVAPWGEDGAMGSREQPIRTIQEAAERLEPGDTGMILPGRYRESVKVTGSGREGEPLSLRSESPGTVILDGTREILGVWETAGAGRWKVAVDFEFDQLFLDGQMLLEARWPNVRFRDLLSRAAWEPAGRGSHYGRIRSENLVGSEIDWTGTRIHLNVAHQYYSWVRRVTDFDPATGELRYPEDLGDMSRFMDQPGRWEDDFFYLVGRKELLDAPGEWYFDRDAGVLYVITPDGRPPLGRLFTGKVRDLGIVAEGVDHLAIKGIEFFATTLRLENCDSTLVEDCHFLFPTRSDGLGNGLRGTRITGDHNTVRRCSLAYSNGGGFQLNGSHSLVEETMVHGVSWDGSLSHVAVRLSSQGEGPGEGGTVRRCTIFNAGNTLVSTTELKNSVVEYSHIFEGGQVCLDVSLVYTHLPLMEGTTFRYNWVHGSNTEHLALGIRGDDQTRNLIIHHNVVWDCSWVGIVAKGDHNIVANNTVFDCGNWGFLLDGGPEPHKPWRNQWPLLQEQNRNTGFYNNYGEGASQKHRHNVPLTTISSHNLLPGDPDYLSLALALMDPANRDFRPHPNSPLVDAGRVVEGIEASFSGTAPDIGAYEYGGEAWVPGVTWDEKEKTRRMYAEVLW